MRGGVVPDWFRRFGDIPGVLYTPREQIDRSSLVGCDDVPEVHTFRFDGQPKETLSCTAGSGSRGGSARASSGGRAGTGRSFLGRPDALRPRCDRSEISFAIALPLGATPRLHPLRA